MYNMGRVIDADDKRQHSVTQNFMYLMLMSTLYSLCTALHKVHTHKLMIYFNGYLPECHTGYVYALTFLLYSI